jgi:hypothetical protein
MARLIFLSDFDIGLIQARANSTGTPSLVHAKGIWTWTYLPHVDSISLDFAGRIHGPHPASPEPESSGHVGKCVVGVMAKQAFKETVLKGSSRSQRVYRSVPIRHSLLD